VIRIITAGCVIAALGYGQILDTAATIRPDNSLIADVQVTAPGAARVSVTYQAAGIDPLVSPLTPLPASGRATITIGRLRANTTYTYTANAIDSAGGPAGTASGGFTTGSLPLPLSLSNFTLTGRTTVPLVILPLLLTGAGDFRGYVGLDLHSADAPQIVWYYNNAPSLASGIPQADAVGSITPEPNGNFLFADAGSGPPPLAADAYIREIAPDGSLLAESPADCSVTPPGVPAPPGWVWGQGNDIPEQLLPGAGGVPGTVLHLGKIVKDPFFDAGLSPQGKRLQAGATIRRWDIFAGVDDIVWDPFAFLDPLAERTDATNSDPIANSNSAGPMACAGSMLLAEDWMHANSLQVTPSGEILMSIRHLDSVIAISPQFDRIAWRIGGARSDFAFSNPADRFYHQHFVRMLDNGNLLLMDNGNRRPAAEGGLYSRALELALDWDSMTATKVWEYRHGVGSGAYKYADKVGSAQRLDNGNTLVLFGADIDPATLAVKDPQTFTLVEAGPDGEPVAVLDMQLSGNFPVYRALPVNALFGEFRGQSTKPPISDAR
jgi:hypothetical protein